MALQTSGPISINQIMTELGTTNGSLRYLSNLAGKSTPDAMSEFYGYTSVITAQPSNVVINRSGTVYATWTNTSSTYSIEIFWDGPAGSYYNTRTAGTTRDDYLDSAETGGYTFKVRYYAGSTYGPWTTATRFF